jgi:hypothetical protein
MNASALAKKLSAHVRRMLKGSGVHVDVPHRAAKLAIFKDAPDSWNFAIRRDGERGKEFRTMVYVRQLMPGSASGLDVLVDGPDAALVRDMIAEAS